MKIIPILKSGRSRPNQPIKSFYKMSLSVGCAILFFGFFIFMFGYGLGLIHGEKDSKDGKVYRDNDDDTQM